MRFDTNTVISWGLVVMGVSAVGGWIAISMMTGTSSGTEVPISIISGLTGVLTGKNMAESKNRELQPPNNPNYSNFNKNAIPVNYNNNQIDNSNKI